MAAGVKQKPGPFKLSTVVHRVAVLSTAHKLKRLANPCELPSVRTLLSRARRAAVKRGIDRLLDGAPGLRLADGRRFGSRQSSQAGVCTLELHKQAVSCHSICTERCGRMTLYG